jgi:Tfp pilus assembly PilM family ATPase
MPADLRELAAVVNFQISKDLPFRIEDAVVDFKVLRVIDVPASAPNAEAPSPEASATKRLEVLAGAVKNDVVQFYNDAAKAAGFKIAALGLRSVAAAHCVAKCVPGGGGAVLLISVRNEEVTIDIVCENKLVFSRVAAVTLSGNSSSEAASADRSALVEALQIEVVRSLHSYEGMSGYQPVQKLFVAGAGEIEAELSASLSERLSLPAEKLDPAARFSIKNGEPEEIAGAANYIAPIGLALAALEPSGLPIDFANPKRPPVQRNKKQTQLLGALAAAMVLLLTFFGVRANLIKKRLKIKEEIQAQLTDAEKKLPIYRRLKSQNKVVNTWVGDEQNWLDHLAYLTAILPNAEEIYVSAFSTSPQHIIRFAVQARTGEMLAELDKKLRAAGYEVKPLSITPANDKHGYSFRTSVELSIPKKMKPDFSKLKPPPRPADDTPPQSTGIPAKTGRPA